MNKQKKQYEFMLVLGRTLEIHIYYVFSGFIEIYELHLSGK